MKNKISKKIKLEGEKKLKHLRYCSCGEIYSHDGWNINEDGEMGNNYNYRGTKCFLIKYTTCTKCGKQVILQKSKKGMKERKKNGKSN